MTVRDEKDDSVRFLVEFMPLCIAFSPRQSGTGLTGVTL